MFRQRAVSGMAVLALTVLIGCSSNGGTPSPVDTSEPALPGHGESSEPEPVEVRVPAVDEGMTALLEAGPTKGPDYVGKTGVAEGIVWVEVICRGVGVLTVDVEPLVNFEVPCGGSGEHTLNQFELDEAYEFDISVSASSETEWVLLVRQCDQPDSDLCGEDG